MSKNKTGDSETCLLGLEENILIIIVVFLINLLHTHNKDAIDHSD